MREGKLDDDQPDHRNAGRGVLIWRPRTDPAADSEGEEGKSTSDKADPAFSSTLVSG